MRAKTKTTSPKAPPRKLRSPRVKIPVTSDFIATAVRFSSEHCMIADAIRAVIPDAAFISVDLQTIRWSDRKKGLRYTYLTPRMAQVALLNFDRGNVPYPFWVRLRGAHITTMHHRPEPRAGKRPAQVARHKLGRRRIDVTKAELAHGNVPGTIGGRPAPIHKMSKNRTFGLKAFTADDLIPIPENRLIEQRLDALAARER
jgi:hypothetical protein